MNILQVAPSSAYPPSTGGEQRVHNLFKSKSREDIVYRFSQTALSKQYETNTNPISIEANYYEYRYKNWLSSLQGFLTNFVDAPPLFASEIMNVFSPEVLNERITWADVIVVEEPWLFPYVAKRTSDTTLLVYSSHNYELELYRNTSSKERSFVANRIEQLERQASHESDLVVTISNRDKQKYQSELNADGLFHVAPAAASKEVDIERTTREINGQETEEEQFISVFVGSEHPPNIQAVEEIFRLATEMDNDFQFKIVGNICSRFDSMDAPDSVELLGYINDINKVYSNAHLALNPMQSGGGVNIKVLDYMAYALPVVTTPFGARGIEGTAGEHFIMAELDEFSTKITKLREESERRRAIAESGYELIKSSLNWSNVSEEFINVIKVLDQNN